MAEKQLAVVSGAARGIGRAVLSRLAHEGFCVACFDRDGGAAAKAADEVNEEGGEAIGVEVDVRERSSVVAALSELGRPVDVLVNNAGVYSDKPFMSVKEADFEEMLSVNLIGLFVLSQEVLRTMPDGGRIIHMASRSYLGARNMAHYGASKAAVVGLTRTMAIEFADRNIAVNAIAPGLVDTPILDQLDEKRREALRELQPTGRMGKPEDVAATVSYLADPRAGFVTGQILVVDGGKSLGGVWM
jgi:3-oxoacyl-[acyl-carrier protein] reductase